MHARFFSERQRTELFLATEGRCANCGVELDPNDFHADHVQPWSGGGMTTIENGQPLCQVCNSKKGGSMLLEHQGRFQEICRELKRDPNLQTIVAEIVCGGGKSIYPVIAAHELVPYRGDGICWVTPRDNLRSQGEDIFGASWLRNLLGHKLEIRQATNEADPMRDTIGYVTTYHAITLAHSIYRDNPHLDTFRRRRMILFLDEPHHIALGEATHQALLPLVQLASVVVLASGSLSRHDNRRIAFLDYRDINADSRSYVDLSDSATRRVIRYNLESATRAHQLIKILFELRDSSASWETETDDGEVIDGELASFEGATKQSTSRALMTALNTDFFEQLLLEAASFWVARRKKNLRSKFIIVCPFIAHAQRALKILAQAGLTKIDIATSENPDEALRAIKRFRDIKQPYLDALVTVGMAYEGLDCPPADVLACLTHVRSREWIEQMLHRVSRFDRGGLQWDQQFATIFAPKDRFFVEIMTEIEAAQAPYVEELIPSPNGNGNGNGGSRTTPIDSELTSKSTHTFGDVRVDPDEHDRVTDALMDSGLYGAISVADAKKFFDSMMTAPNEATHATASTGETVPDDAPIPPSAREKELRTKIEALKRSDYQPNEASSRDRLKERGRRIWRMFNKGIPSMTEKELRAVWERRGDWM